MRRTGEVRSADLYDGCVIDLRERLAGLDRPGHRRRAAGARSRSCRSTASSSSRASPRRSGSVADAPGRARGPAGRHGSARRRPEHRRVRPAPGARASAGDAGDRPPRRGARARRLAPHARRCARPRRPTRTSSRTSGETELEPRVHVPRLPLRGGRDGRRGPRRDVRGHQQRHAAARLVRAARTPALDAASTRTSSGRSATTSSRVPTDCPQRDERLGWTGDAQAFAPTGSHARSTPQAFWASWLRDLALDQDDELGVPERRARRGRSTASRASGVRAGRTPPRSCPGPCTSPTATPQILRDQLDEHAALGRRRCARGWARTACSPPSMQFGDWLDPDAPADRPWEAKADSTYLANAFFVATAPGSRPMPPPCSARRPGRAEARALADARRGDDLGALGATTPSRPRPAARSRSGFGMVARRGASGAVARRLAATRARGGGAGAPPASWARRSCCRRSPTPATSTRRT